MIKNTRALNIIGILTVLLLVEATSTTTITTLLNTTNAQAPTLGEPFLVEKGKITGQKEIGPNRTQFTYSANGTLNGNIEITDTGDYVSVSKVTISHLI
jgi:hypothetical protein